MASRLVRFQVGVHGPERRATPVFPGVRLTANIATARATAIATARRQHPAGGVGTRNFLIEILDIYAGLDKGRKQRLIDYSSRLADEQRADRPTAD